MSDKTNAIGPNTKNMTINVPESLLKKIDALAQKSNMSRSQYLKTFLEQEAVKKQVTYTMVIKKGKVEGTKND